jgi:hypothetical protein
MAHLPISDKGYPVPWFVEWIDGKPDFRIMDADKLIDAVRYKRCWVCGGTLGKFKTFVVGPMCVVNRTAAEPPSHHDCALFSATACPFLTLPKATRREANMPENKAPMPGIMIPRNPGVTCLWTVQHYRAYKTQRGPLFNIGDPARVEWYAEKALATREQVSSSIETGMPILRGLAAEDGPDSMHELQLRYDVALSFIPKELGIDLPPEVKS